MEQIKLLLAASASIPEQAIRYYMEELSNFEGPVGFVEGNPGLRRFVIEKWPDAESVKVKKVVSARQAMARFDHLVLLWDGEDLASLLFEARLQKKKTKLIPLSVTKVVNKRTTDDYDVYIGRGSLWGNPFAIGHGEGPDRAEVIELYRAHFHERIATDDSFKRGVLALRGLRLACFCKPQACHGDVIAEYLDALPDRADGGDASS